MKLPENKEEWEVIKLKFAKLACLEDTPETWTFILSQLQNTKMPELTFDYTSVINHYKRWKIAEVLQKEKMIYLQQLQDKLKDKIEALGEPENGSSSSDLPREPHDIHAVLSPLPAS